MKLRREQAAANLIAKRAGLRVNGQSRLGLYGLPQKQRSNVSAAVKWLGLQPAHMVNHDRLRRNLRTVLTAMEAADQLRKGKAYGR